MVVKIVGLGLIGGSLALALSRAKERRVIGEDASPAVREQAVKKGAVITCAACDLEATEEADVVFVCLPPRAAYEYLAKKKFRKGCLVSDFCGVKRGLLPAAQSAIERCGIRYIGAHPMAGKEKQGFQNADANLFCGASLIFCAQSGDKDAAVLTRLLSPAGFGNFIYADAEEHDKTIALTSQLAHVVSSAYVKNAAQRVDGFTGGSFEDMTRVAYLDSAMWTQLFFLNADYLADEIDKLISSLTLYRDALLKNDPDQMRSLLEEGKKIKEQMLSLRQKNK